MMPNRLALSVVVLLSACGSGPTTGNTPEEMFSHLIASPPPAYITELQGTGDTWQGHRLWLRFRADPVLFEQLLNEQGYRETPCDPADWTLPEHYDVFEPSWKPVLDVCSSAERSTDWGQSHHVIARDTATGTYSFYAIAP